jgi:hypothetical protein
MIQKLSLNLQLLIIAFISIGFGFGFAIPSFSQLQIGWITLIDGETGLDNWYRIGDANWQAVDGAIQADSRSGERASFLMTKEFYSDFRLRVEFWASEDADSGIFLRCSNPDQITDLSCYEANIFDHSPEPLYGTGSLVNLFPLSLTPKAGGRWNVYEITALGSRLVLILNGEKTADVRDGQFTEGPIGLEYSAGTIKFRRVEIQPL